MQRTCLIILGLTTAATLTVQAQQWTPEQQEVIDAERACYDTWVNALVEQRSWDAFLEGCTAGHWVWWNTGEGAPEIDEQVRRWWEQVGYPRGLQPNWITVKPLHVKVRGNVGLLFAYIRDTSNEDSGEIQENEYKALVVFHKEDGTYQLISGMYAPGVEQDVADALGLQADDPIVAQIGTILPPPSVTRRSGLFRVPDRCRTRTVSLFPTFCLTEI